MDLIFVTALMTIFTVVNCQTNCGIGAECDKCGSNSTTLLVNSRLLKVCCKNTCSSYYQAGYSDPVKKIGPYCSCTFEKVSGDCWKGDICKTCDSKYVGNINRLPVCCQNCEKSGLSLSPTSCTCLQNGK